MESASPLISSKQELLSLLTKANLHYQLQEHPPIFNAEDGKKHAQHWMHIKGSHTKNLFLRNQKKTAYWLITIKIDKQVDLLALGKILDAGRLSFANPVELQEMLGITPGSVTPFAIINDKNKHIQLILDEDLLSDEYINVHPMENTATITIKLVDLQNFIENHHPLKFAAIPGIAT